QLKAKCKPGRVVDHWEVTTHGLFTRSTQEQPGETLILSLGRGDRLSVRPVLRDAPQPDISDKDRFQGTWVAVSGEFRGQPLTADHLGRMTLTFAGGRARITLPDGNEGEGTFKLDPTQSPKEFDLIRAGDNLGMLGIYSVDGDRLTLCLGGPGEPRPTRFDA